MVDLSHLDAALRVAQKSEEWEEAVRVCREGVAATEGGRFPDWFFFRFHLADFLRELAAEPALEEAISVCLDILPRIPPTRSREIALTHMLMGDLYEKRDSGSEEENCRTAIAHFSAALDYPAAQGDLLMWASVVTGIGYAWARLGETTTPPERPPESVAAQLREAIRIFNERQCPEEAAEATEALEKIEHVSSAPETGV